MIDTDIAIDYLRGISSAKDLILPLWKTNTAYLSILTVYELHAGMRKREKEDTNNFISACNIEPVTIEIAKRGGEIFRHYRTQGITLTSTDCLINATAIVRGHKIAARNKEHYPDKKMLWKH
jgi:predicted nucleic acid-binding protein